MNYQATLKKPEHGGGWAFMQHNRREGSRIICECGAGGWEEPGHDNAVEAERCFHDTERAKGARWEKYGQATKCVICGEWTDDGLTAVSMLVTPIEYVCREHFEGDDRPDPVDWLWARHPFVPGIQIAASW